MAFTIDIDTLYTDLASLYKAADNYKASEAGKQAYVGPYQSLGTMYGPIVVNPPKSTYWTDMAEPKSEVKLLSVEDRLRALIKAYDQFPSRVVTAHIKTFVNPIYKNIVTMFPNLEKYQIQISLVKKVGWLTFSWVGLTTHSHPIEVWKEN